MLLILLLLSDFTRFLQSIDSGDSRHGGTAEELLPLVYDELRRLAAAKMAKEPAGHTLQPTALVHEAWLRLAGSQARDWENRGHFFSAAAEAMRRILIESARRKSRIKRGSGQPVEQLSDTHLQLQTSPSELLAVHEALDALAEEDSLAAEVAKLRYFVGMPIPAIAEALGISVRTVDRHWAFARCWLKEAMEDKR